MLNTKKSSATTDWHHSLEGLINNVVFSGACFTYSVRQLWWYSCVSLCYGKRSVVCFCSRCPQTQQQTTMYRNGLFWSQKKLIPWLEWGIAWAQGGHHLQLSYGWLLLEGSEWGWLFLFDESSLELEPSVVVCRTQAQARVGSDLIYDTNFSLHPKQRTTSLTWSRYQVSGEEQSTSKRPGHILIWHQEWLIVTFWKTVKYKCIGVAPECC